MIIKTLYPDDSGAYHITLQGLTTNKYRSSLNISCIVNNDSSKIPYSEHEAFMQKHIDDLNNLYSFSEIKNSVASFSDFFVCMEDFRNISKGYIEELRNDSSIYPLKNYAMILRVTPLVALVVLVLLRKKVQNLCGLTL